MMKRRILNGSLCVMMCIIMLAFTVKKAPPEKKFTDDCSFVTMKDLRFEKKIQGERPVITASFVLESEKDSPGEIEIYIDGIQKANNRLIIKKGVSHYKLDFMIVSQRQEEKRSYSVTTKLLINEITAETRYQVLE